ncbi:MAG: exosortase-associated EpsI family protein [Phycisphaerales bacterium]|nr:MAG: exosortase-associated EpsI family protein [Phycisphaerales bacterium]
MDKPGYVTAALVAAALLLGSGIGYRAVASRLSDFIGIAPLPQGTLAQLPLRIGEWVGQDVPVDERILKIADVDDYVNRIYERRGEKATASLFLAFRRRDVAYGVPVRALMPHHPKVCYPATGWTFEESQQMALEEADGSMLPVEVLRFRRGELEVERVAVACYYIVEGRTGPSVAALRPRGWRPKGDLRYVAQIQIACNEGLLGTSAEEQVRAFAVDSAPAIRSLITRAVKREDASDTGRAD